MKCTHFHPFRRLTKAQTALVLCSLPKQRESRSCYTCYAHTQEICGYLSAEIFTLQARAYNFNSPVCTCVIKKFCKLALSSPHFLSPHSFYAVQWSIDKKAWCSGTRHSIIKVNGGKDHQTLHMMCKGPFPICSKNPS